MPYYCKIIKDSIGPNNKRLTTIEVCYPRIVHQEFLRHRVFSRNAASSRAIPWKKWNKDGILNSKCMVSLIQNDTFIPFSFGKEQKGMQSGYEIDEINKEIAEKIWIEARDNAIKSADNLSILGIHKSICNRLTEPFMYITELISGTDWNNFFKLRCHEDAEKHIQKIAYLIKDEINKSIPQKIEIGNWHLPYIYQEDIDECYKHFKDSEENIYKLKMISSGRCARLSYLTQDGKRDLNEDINLAKRLTKSGHWSPFEHIAQASNDPKLVSGPFKGWLQFRKQFLNENME